MFNGTNDTIYEYQLDTKRCSKFKISKNNYNLRSGVQTLDEQYVICIVLLSDDFKIAVFDLRAKEFTRNDIEAPDEITSGTRLYIVNDYEKAEVLATGYIRTCAMKFPMDIAGILLQYVTLDALYSYDSNGTLLRFDMNEIIQKCR